MWVRECLIKCVRVCVDGVLEKVCVDNECSFVLIKRGKRQFITTS